MPEVKIDGQNVEATVEPKEVKEQPEKEETKMEKKSGKAKKIVFGILGAIGAAGAIGFGILKAMGSKGIDSEFDSAQEIGASEETTEE